jgi:hypothetical protein
MKSWKPIKQKRKSKVVMANLGKIEKKAVIDVGAPSYTSGDHT